MGAEWGVPFGQNGVWFLVEEILLCLCWASPSQHAEPLKFSLSLRGEQASLFPTTDSEGPSGLLLVRGVLGVAGCWKRFSADSFPRRPWRQDSHENCGVVFLRAAPPGKGREGGEIEVKCTLHLGDRFSILLLEFLKIPLHSPWWEKKTTIS